MQEIKLKTSDEEKDIGKILQGDKKTANSGGPNGKPSPKFDFSFLKKLIDKISKSKAVLGVGIGIVAFAVVFLVFLISHIRGAFEPEVALGNLSNNGKVFHDGESVYLGLAEGLFKETDGVLTKISNDRATSIFRQGDAVYYLNSASQRSFDIKMIKDGSTEPQTIKTIYTSINKICVSQDSIYYVSSENGYGIRKISMQDMNEGLVVLANIVDFTIEDDMLYYTDIVGKLERLNLSKKEDVPYTIDSTHSIRKFQVKDKWIYFYNNKEGGLCKIKMNGKGFGLVNKNIKNDSFNISSKGNIYFLDGAKTKICKGKIDGNSFKTIAETKITNSTINIAAGNLYYENYASETSSITKLYRVKTNGKAAKEIVIPEEKEETTSNETIELEEVKNTTANENKIEKIEESEVIDSNNESKTSEAADNVDDNTNVEDENVEEKAKEETKEETKEDVKEDSSEGIKKDSEKNSDESGNSSDVVTILTDDETTN